MRTGVPAVGLGVEGGRAAGVAVPGGTVAADAVIATPALPIIADLAGPHLARGEAERLRRIRYLANVCVVLELDRSLFTMRHLRTMFPDFETGHVLDSHVWRARYAQPIMERGYRRLIPPVRTSIENFFVATMAQIYPEDRGTNYAIREGREAARLVGEAVGAGG